MTAKVLDKKGLIAAVFCPTEDVPIGDQGKKVRLRGLTAVEATEFQKETHAVVPDLAALDAESPEKVGDFLALSASLIVKCVIDGEGNRIFADDETATILKWPMVTLIKLRDVAMRLSGMEQIGDEDPQQNP